ncbi:hypothetical protein [Deinococcus yavapaiensis]|uniref:Uncharacterized protein n=1 Tax=Deinococcus yavapaiensis KR-236 TaxID=694435 RepID=A0A318S766_9DEIO|nr:hypothetical protein [Deinococcus yavapaiensis]PYE53635.1 hypothetical protein DES52_108166 [Deinococcus yavapaiensis KR-236]
MPDEVKSIIALETYEPEVSRVLSIYLENLYVAHHGAEGAYHVWVTTTLGRQYRVTEDGFATAEEATTHAHALMQGISAHLRANGAGESEFFPDAPN